MLLFLAIVTFSGCASAEPRAEGTVTYRASGERGASVIRLTTAAQAVQVGRTRPDLRPGSGEGPAIETPLLPGELGALIRALEDDGFFDLPGRDAAPPAPAPRSIAVETTERRFYVILSDLREKPQIEVYARAARRIIVASQAGPHYELSPQK